MIHVYSMENCPKCQHLKSLLTSLGHEYVELKVEEKENFDALLMRGYDHVPVLMYSKKGFPNHFLSKGFTKKNVTKFLELVPLIEKE